MKKIYIKPLLEINVVELQNLLGVAASADISGEGGGTLPWGGNGSDDPDNPDEGDANRFSLWEEY